jgi:hypothetical protein
MNVELLREVVSALKVPQQRLPVAIRAAVLGECVYYHAMAQIAASRGAAWLLDAADRSSPRWRGRGAASFGDASVWTSTRRCELLQSELQGVPG